jgi:hypothetical protein
LLLAPILRKDVVDIDVLAEEDRILGLKFTGPPVFSVINAPTGKLARWRQSSSLCDPHPKPSYAENRAIEEPRGDNPQEACSGQKGLFETWSLPFWLLSLI